MGKGVESGTRDLYEVLEVSPSAPEAEIRSAFRRLAAKYHPDQNPSAHAAIHFKRVNAAFQVLVDPERRATYDALTGQVDPAPPDVAEVHLAAPQPPPDGWYLSRNGTCEGPVPPEFVVGWIGNGLREGMVRFGVTGQWHPLTHSVFAKFVPPPMPPPRLLYVSEADVGRKGNRMTLKVMAGVTIAIVAVVTILAFVLPPSSWRRWVR